MNLCTHNYVGIYTCMNGFLAVGKSSSRHRLTAGRSGKIKLACVLFVAPPSFIALQRIAVRRTADHIVLYGQ